MRRMVKPQNTNAEMHREGYNQEQTTIPFAEMTVSCDASLHFYWAVAWMRQTPAFVPRNGYEKHFRGNEAGCNRSVRIAVLEPDRLEYSGMSTCPQTHVPIYPHLANPSSTIARTASTAIARTVSTAMFCIRPLAGVTHIACTHFPYYKGKRQCKPNKRNYYSANDKI